MLPATMVSRLTLAMWIPLLWAMDVAACGVKSAPGAAGPRVDVKFRAGVPLDDPLLALPAHLRARVRRIAPLVTLSRQEAERIGATSAARWFRLELAPDADLSGFMAELAALDAVEAVEKAAEPAPDPGG